MFANSGLSVGLFLDAETSLSHPKVSVLEKGNYTFICRREDGGKNLVV